MDLQDIVDQVHAELNRLDQAIAALQGTTPRRGRPPKAVTDVNRRVMSVAARKRISAAMKARWAARKKSGGSPNETGKNCSKEGCSSSPDDANVLSGSNVVARRPIDLIHRVEILGQLLSSR